MTQYAYELTTLPYFRVAGLAQVSSQATRTDDAAQLWQTFLSGSLKDVLPAFSNTLYCVYHDYQDDGRFTMLLGKLVATDAELPEGASDVWVAPQQYAAFELSEKQFQAALPIWQYIEEQKDIQRYYRADFESYPNFGVAKLYIGVQGEVQMEEEVLIDE